MAERPAKYLVISADCHAAARWADYEPYLERRHLEAFRAWYGAGGERPALRPGEDRLFDTSFLDALDGQAAVASGGRSGTWDADQRARELDADGVAGEVIFPAAENFHAPFHGLHPLTRAHAPQPRELRAAGTRAYNRHEVELRSAIGVDKIMWGSDYPHAEGTWPNTRKWLHDAFAGIPSDELGAMLGGNAARVYGFEPDKLAGLVARIGPEPDSFA